MTEKNQRNSQIMWINALAILLVVVGHADITSAYDQLWIKRWIYSFHMPLFVFVSGFLFCYTNPRFKGVSIGHFLMKKVRRLLLSFLVVNSIIFLIKTFFSSDEYVQHPVVLTWDSYIDSTLFHPIGFMWFLPALFMIFVLYVVIAKQLGFGENRPFNVVKKDRRVKNVAESNLLIDSPLICNDVRRNLLLPGYRYSDVINFTGIHEIKRTLYWLGIGGICWGISRCFPDILFMQISPALSYSLYFGLGIVYAMHKKVIDSGLTKYRWVGLFILGVCSFSLLLPSVLGALVGIFFVISISLSVRQKVRSKFVMISKYSFTIYLLSYFPQMLIRGPIYHHFGWINEYVFSGLSIVSGVALPIGFGIVYSGVKNKNQLTKFFGNAFGL